MLFRGNLEHGWYRLAMFVDSVTNHLCDMLINENDGNVVAVGETLERFLDLRQRRVLIYRLQKQFTFTMSVHKYKVCAMTR